VNLPKSCIRVVSGKFYMYYSICYLVLECKSAKQVVKNFKIATHYSKSQFFVQKFNFDKISTFSRVFTQIFLTIFLVESKLSTAKKSKTTTISRVFHPQKLTIFLGNQSWIFGQKMKISNSVCKRWIYIPSNSREEKDKKLHSAINSTILSRQGNRDKNLEITV